MHISETFFEDQAVSRVDVTTKDHADELGYKGKNMYACMYVCVYLYGGFEARFEELGCLSEGI